MRGSRTIETLDEVAEARKPGLRIDHRLACRINDRRRPDQDVLASLQRSSTV